MKFFPVLRTRRLTVQLKEITIGDAIAIAAMPPEDEQAECTAFLRAALAEKDKVLDPADWTVEERLLAIAHYIASTSEEGPDFSVGDNAKYSDFLMGDKDLDPTFFDNPPPAGELEGDKWKIQYLTGRMAESIERLVGEIKDGKGNPLPPRLHWMIGTMAAQLIREGETVPKPEDGEGKYDEYLAEKMKVFTFFPETGFIKLLFIYHSALEKMEHFFKMRTDEKGLFCYAPKENAAGQIPAARFPAYSCLSPFTLKMAE